nr:hypothetical protein [uncultured Psychroserpens sp.]
MIEYLLAHSPLIINIFEFSAALVGTLAFYKTKNPLFKSVALFLWFTLFVEIIGKYTWYLDDYSFLSSLKGTVFQRNYWLFNFYGIFQVFFYVLIFYTVVNTKLSNLILKSIFVLYAIAISIILIVNNDDYFIKYINDNFYAGAFTILICVFVYFYEILQSDKILKFYNSFMFYCSLGLLIWWLIFPPLIVYYGYYQPIYPEFIELRNIILMSVNVFMYSCFIFGFIWHKEQ